MNKEFETDPRRERIIKGEPWNHLYNPLIMDVFLEYQERGGVLFGITGDLDNLGIYVARNGRPNAENLVDLYNQITRNFLEGWVDENRENIKTLAFVPSGEEVFIVGIAGNKKTAEDLFSQLRDGVMKLMQSQSYIDLGGTSASFGGKVFGDELDSKIKPLVEAAKLDKPDEVVFPLYLEILSKIRKETAIELDRQKFKDILDGIYPVQTRQIVLIQMILYKIRTREIVRFLNKLSEEEIKSLLALLGDSYGVLPNIEYQVNRILTELWEAKNDKQ